MTKVRFAPSPTGFLHVGGARTALFNWLHARHAGGKFVLRIEDTDRERSTEAATEAILEGMRWLGLDWDEGPHHQMDRLEAYARAAETLTGEGRAYECFCTSEELEDRRRLAREEGRSPRYDRRCCGLGEAERERLVASGRKPVIRFKAPETGESTIEDLVRGPVTFKNELLDDLVIMRADGVPTYNFAVVIDDHDMGITDVIRGEDHLPNTPRQLMIYEALGYEAPRFGHLPLILGPDKALLSKRHGATSVSAYRDEGYLPDAMFNYLALIGWSLDDKTTVMSRSQLVEGFTLERVGKAPGVFDVEKLRWMNGMYIRDMAPEELTVRLLPFWVSAGLLAADAAEKDRERLVEIAKVCQERLTLLGDVVPLTEFFFGEPVYDEAAVRKVLRREGAAEALESVGELLGRLTDWTTASIEDALRGLADDMGLKPGKLFQPIRVAISGKTVSPPLFESLWLLGRDTSLQRLDAGIAKASQPLT